MHHQLLSLSRDVTQAYQTFNYRLVYSLYSRFMTETVPFYLDTTLSTLTHFPGSP